MLQHKLVYLEVDSKSVLKDAFSEIRDEVEKAASRPELTELYCRAGYLIDLTTDTLWEKNFFDDIEEVRHTVEAEFGKTVRKINRQAEKFGFEGKYDEIWAE